MAKGTGTELYLRAAEGVDAARFAQGTLGRLAEQSGLVDISDNCLGGETGDETGFPQTFYDFRIEDGSIAETDSWLQEDKNTTDGAPAWRTDYLVCN
jgi:hypothetical protein